MGSTCNRSWICFALAAGVAAGCAAALDHPTERDVAWASARWPQTSMNELERGRALYVERCAGCHYLPLPAKYSPEEWEGYVAYMVAEAKLMPDEQDAIVRYLAATSARARGVPPVAGAAVNTTK